MFFFGKNMIILIVKKLKAGPSNLAECIGNRPNMSQMGLGVFNWLLTINATAQTIFKQIIFLKNVQKMRIHCKIYENFLFDC